MAPEGQSRTHILQPMHLDESNFSLPRKFLGISIFVKGYSTVAGFRQIERRTSDIILPGFFICRAFLSERD